MLGIFDNSFNTHMCVRVTNITRRQGSDFHFDFYVCVYSLEVSTSNGLWKDFQCPWGAKKRKKNNLSICYHKICKHEWIEKWILWIIIWFINCFWIFFFLRVWKMMKSIFIVKCWVFYFVLNLLILMGHGVICKLNCVNWRWWWGAHRIYITH